ncbi:hypothetical protein AQUCO_08400043v1 [Aquilegia coerulea]|uniref:Pentacotripeptide-repeat region of PRORP domain-containing protein n=1 Tax=Aquilegia coerulea TaxID=218851 RepID=A0A2G5C6T8_AQUCA|nr:hypothetical protein AQUCO_08400043v1 [Aquilegia coerulea]
MKLSSLFRRKTLKKSTIRPRKQSSCSCSCSLSPSLRQRVLSINDPKASIEPVLQKWVDEGKTVIQSKLVSYIHTLTKINRFHHALQISEWMTDRRYFDLTSNDVTVRLKLIYRVHGLEHTEKYFGNISKDFKVVQTYGTLLDCYVKEKVVDKAEAIMQEMKTMGFASSPFPYNWLINLYAQTGHQEKIGVLLAEMVKKGIPQDKYTLTNCLSSCIAVSDIEGMEKILKQMEDPSICVDWHAYTVAAKGYLKLGLIDKGLEMLKRIEEMRVKDRSISLYNYLLTFYTSAGKKDDVYRIWNLYKSKGTIENSSYAHMIKSLEKLDDLEGAEKILEEWESQCSSYDFRVLNQLVSAYCKRGLFEKAEMLVQNSVQKGADSGRSPYPSTWNIIAMGYISNKQMIKGVQMLKNAFLLGRRGWKPNPVTIASCLEYFKVQRDVQEAEDFVELLGASGLLTKEVYHWLLRIYIAANKPVSPVLDLMKADGFSVDEETHLLLQESSDS